MKKLIIKINTSNEFNEDAQMKWEFLKYEIRKFTIDYSKKATKIRKQQKINLEQKLKNLENNLTSEENRKLVVEEKETTNHKEISKSINTFYETLFKKNFPKTNVKKQTIP